MKNLSVLISKDDFEIFEVEVEEKKKLIGSKYNNEKNIQEAINILNENSLESVIVFFGLGSGKNISKLCLEKINKEKVIIVEPSEEIYNYNIQHYSENIKAIDAKYIMVDHLLQSYSSYIDYKDSIEFKYIDLYNYKTVYCKEYETVLKLLRDTLEIKIFNHCTARRFEKTHIENYIYNIKGIAKSFPINQFEKSLSDKSAIIVSAGPSLSKNIDILKKNKDKFIIITGQRTLRPLLDRGIIPDIVCSIDPHILCYDMVKDLNCDDILLLHCITSNYKLVNEFQNRIILGDESIGKFAEKYLKENIRGLYSGGSVAHTCVALADYLGCDPIVLIGQDLAYTDNKIHADIAANKIENEIEKDSMWVKGIYGGEVKTDRSLNFYRKNMEEYIRASNSYGKTEYIDATEGGAFIEGTQVAKLEEVAKNFKKIDKRLIKKEFLNAEKIKLDIDYIHKLNENLKSLKNEAHDYVKKLAVHLTNEEYIKTFTKINMFIDKIRNEESLVLYLETIEDKILFKKEYKISSNIKKEDELIYIMKKQMLDFLNEILDIIEYIEVIIIKVKGENSNE